MTITWTDIHAWVNDPRFAFKLRTRLSPELEVATSYLLADRCYETTLRGTDDWYARMGAFGLTLDRQTATEDDARAMHVRMTEEVSTLLAAHRALQALGWDTTSPQETHQ